MAKGNNKYSGPGPVEPRFLEYVNKTDTCWIWTGSLGGDNRNYGSFNVNGRTKRAHRVSYELYKEKIPKGLLVLHSCDNPSCVNPEHLFLGTQKDNMQDMSNKGRSLRGDKSIMSKLTNEQVLEIRSKYIPKKYSTRTLAKEYGVSPYVIYCIVKNITYKV